MSLSRIIPDYTLGQLRELTKDLPDNTPIGVFDDGGFKTVTATINKVTIGVGRNFWIADDNTPDAIEMVVF